LFFRLYIFCGGLFLTFVFDKELYFLFDLAILLTTGKHFVLILGPIDYNFSIMFIFS